MSSYKGDGCPGEIGALGSHAEAIHLTPEGHRGGGFGFKPFRTATSGYPNPMVSGGARIGGAPNIERSRSFGKPPKV